VEHGLNTGAVAVIAACVVLWAVMSGRLERMNVTAPIAFLGLGLAVTHPPLSLIHLSLHSSAIRAVAEVTLALVLFADASRVNVRALRAEAGLPVRLLAIGLPLTIAAGTAAAVVLFDGIDVWVAAAIGAIVAPTDAALGASIMQDKRVPSGVRRLLNVESGLNDGIATPFVNLFLAGGLAAESVHTAGVAHAAVELVTGAAVGLGVGLAGAALLLLADRRGWSAPAFRSLGVLGLALLGYSAAIEAGGNGFVAAFVAGIGFGSLMPREDELTLGFTDDAGELLSLLVWFAFGAIMLVPGFEHAGWQDVVFAVLALTVVRMAPVALALLGSGLGRTTVAFIGWFGPRGLASVVFGLIAVDSLPAADANRILAAVSVTVALSVVAHGITASPFARRYARSVATLPTTGKEHTASRPLPIRSLAGDRRREILAPQGDK
jgi:sodium/hydrogen antiporter